MHRVMQYDATTEQVAKLEKRLNFEIKQRQDTTRALQSVRFFLLILLILLILLSYLILLFYLILFPSYLILFPSYLILLPFFSISLIVVIDF
jgi:cell division septal protein FtsQ